MFSKTLDSKIKAGKLKPSLKCDNKFKNKSHTNYLYKTQTWFEQNKDKPVFADGK